MSDRRNTKMLDEECISNSSSSLRSLRSAKMSAASIANGLNASPSGPSLYRENDDDENDLASAEEIVLDATSPLRLAKESAILGVDRTRPNGSVASKETIANEFESLQLAMEQSRQSKAGAINEASVPDTYTIDGEPLGRSISKGKALTKQKSYKLRERDILALQQQGFPRGLAKTLSVNNEAFPLRIWVVDNSGSMMQRDGHRIAVSTDNSNNHKVQLMNCTRWEEIQQTVEYHSKMAADLRSPTVFRMLNSPGQGELKQFSIGERGRENIDEDLSIALRTIRDLKPKGATPLTKHVLEIRSDLLSMEPSLRESGSKIAIVLATDGLPSDKEGFSKDSAKTELIEALRSLEGLPVWVVVRLCTDDDDVVDFYNQLDGQLELNLEVLDDFSQEALEVTEYNGWLNYALPLHRCREMGYYNRLFDLLDERQLSQDELREFVWLLFGSENSNKLPDPQVDWKGFLRCIKDMVENEQKQWDPVKKRMAPWVDMKVLDKIYRPKRKLFKR